MNRRREVLSGTVVLSISSIAGCLDSLSKDDPENSNNQNTEPNSPSAPSTSSSDNDNSDSDTNSNNNGETNEDGQAENSGIEDRQTRQEIADIYDDGIRDLNSGVDDRNSGVSAYNNENFSVALSHYESAEESYRSARDHFTDAIDLTYEIEHSNAREECEKAAEYALLWRDAMQESQLGVEAAQAEEFDRANERADSVRELEREANRINIQTADTIATILNID
ncbi:hypothetical protein [Natrinema longum]|uniref:Uncharacterized protein n=1 Tax=Natrinema longum TaxID=370324 RepID=A0A8A2U6W4_9EURY|nr:hypothetical protein [Natrinema longum]MBZ6494354.1 hypothetical protein [Natrinema longum]QSW84323.1 hypothetical protein J0X27_12785 [Natrinema longum]